MNGQEVKKKGSINKQLRGQTVTVGAKHLRNAKSARGQRECSNCRALEGRLLQLLEEVRRKLRE
jgi:hypothetical protein